MTPNYLFEDLPTNYPFQYEGMTITKLIGGAMRVEGANINLLALMFLGPKTDTGLLRDINKIRPSRIMASIGHVFLMADDDGFTIEEYDETGTVHYAQFFTKAPDAGRVFAKQTLGLLSNML